MSLPPSAPLPGRRWHVVGLLILLLWGTFFALGCGQFGPEEPPDNEHGPGRRSQRLALTPSEELELGRQAYAEILRGAEVVRRGPDVERVRRVSSGIIEAARIRPLQREINLRYKEQWFEWEFAVLRDRQINAFCLPGGKVGVFTGILRVTTSDDQLATVLSHEIAHALAHHASERIAYEQMFRQSSQALRNSLSSLEEPQRDRLLRTLAPGTGLRSRAYEREQELEADHIGVFLMTFAGYDAGEAVRFWQRMRQATGGGGLPEIFSDHPSDERRIAEMQGWVPYARAAKKAYDEGRIAPEAR